MPRAAVTALLMSTLVTGCFLDRAGRSTPSGLDAGDPADAGAPAQLDAGPTLEDDAGPAPDGAAPDAGPTDCSPGRVDVDGDPANGCECVAADPPTELCNGRDDDCDPETFDGMDDPRRGMRCDGADADRCLGGTWVCNVGALACTDPLEDEVEVCDGATDEDCDGVVDEAGAVGAMVYHPDNDADGAGSATRMATACAPPSGWVTDGSDCDDTTPAVRPGLAESCNGRDDDCSGGPDDGACPGCVVRTYLGRPYLFCGTGRSWGGARDYCDSFGDGTRRYRLVKIDDEAENAWVSARARELAGGGWWIGLSQDGGTWRWTDGSGAVTRWQSGQPDDGGFGVEEDCVEINAFAGDRWNDLDCDRSRPMVCEWPE